jgi:hypothetical protein
METISAIFQILDDSTYISCFINAGKLTADQIKAGYKALKKIDACIEKKDFGSTLNNACDEFYTRIPHDFG